MARLSPNYLACSLGATYVNFFRTIPLILQIIFWYQIIGHLPDPRQSLEIGGLFFLSNRGLYWPTLHLAGRAVWVIVAVLLVTLVVISLKKRVLDSAHVTRKRVLWSGLAAIVALVILGSLGQENPIDIPHLAGLNIRGGGFPILKSFDEGSPADRAFKGNVYSLLALARAAASYLKASPSGRIVAVGSFTSHVFHTDIRQFPMSAASKGAVETAVRSLAMPLAEARVTVNCVVPGFIRKPTGAEDSVSDEELDTNLAKVALGHAGHPDDVAAAIKFLLSVDAPTLPARRCM
ncbi:SDR family oxidoreductase [Ensifer sp. NBAIM29]|nr:SDR family oxidoreductase [Ensifer sp. NBAIM29]